MSREPCSCSATPSLVCEVAAARMKRRTLLGVIWALAVAGVATTRPALASDDVEAGFSPGESAEKLVVQVISSAQQELCVLAYSFTSSRIVKALLDARKRGAAVYLVADSTASGPGNRYARSALSALVNAGASVRLTGAFAAAHDKVIVADRRTVQTGSFNYSKAAATKNAENVLVVRNNPALASQYVDHFMTVWDTGAAFEPRY